LCSCLLWLSCGGMDGWRRQVIDGVPTDLAVSIFADRVFIAVTQLGTFGTLVRLYICTRVA